MALVVLGGLLGAAVPAHAADPLRYAQWGLGMVEADAARATTDGAGATVAVVDTGAQLSHPDLQGRLVAGHDFISDDSSPDDGEGHGTHVAGIVAANSGNGVGVESVAPGARVLVVRVLDNSGSGSVSGVAKGIDYAVDHGADVINLSLSEDGQLFGPTTTGPYAEAVDRALDRGVVVVAAAGNDGTGACNQPSSQGRLLCVGAVDRYGNRSYFSNFGQGLAISGPGGSGLFSEQDDILSTARNSGYEYIAGTSQATPHVAGVAALLVSLGVRGQSAVQRILATARDAGATGPDGFYGAGIVNARTAVAGLSRPPGGGSTPTSPPPAAGPVPLPASGGSAVRILVVRVQRLGTILRWGMRVRCTAAGNGLCRTWVHAAGRRIAYGQRFVAPGREALVTARLTPAGRSLIGAVMRRRDPRLRRLYATHFVAAPGTRTQRRFVTMLYTLPPPR